MVRLRTGEKNPQNNSLTYLNNNLSQSLGYIETPIHALSNSQSQQIVNERDQDCKQKKIASSAFPIVPCECCKCPLNCPIYTAFVFLYCKLLRSLHCLRNSIWLEFTKALLSAYSTPQDWFINHGPRASQRREWIEASKCTQVLWIPMLGQHGKCPQTHFLQGRMGMRLEGMREDGKAHKEWGWYPISFFSYYGFREAK